MAEIVRRRSWGGVLPLGRHVSISGSSLIQCASVSMAPPHPGWAKCYPGAKVQGRTGPSAEQAICSSQQYGSCLFVACPRQLWRVWPGVSGALSAVGLSLLLLSRPAVGASLLSADEVPLPLHPDRAGGRAGLGGFMPAAQRAGGDPLCARAGAWRTLAAPGSASSPAGAVARTSQRPATDGAAH